MRRLTFGTNAHLVLCVALEETLDTAARELDPDKLVSNDISFRRKAASCIVCEGYVEAFTQAKASRQ